MRSYHSCNNGGSQSNTRRVSGICSITASGTLRDLVHRTSKHLLNT